MSYLKPQYPMGNKDGYFYPLTTADQVLLSDGTRLEQGGKVITDESKNSKMLGGKAPSYYLFARNLLDNSDFTNPVKQAGVNGLHGTTTYVVDRWINANAVPAHSDVEGVIVDGETDLIQRLEHYDAMAGKTYTFAIMTTNGISCTTFIMGGNTDGLTLETGITFFSVPDHHILVRQEGWHKYIWIALYEGEYTADTLPPYVPKGYIVELVECKRYFKLLNDWWCLGYSVQGAGYYIVEVLGDMHSKPSVLIKSEIQIYNTTSGAWFNSSIQGIDGKSDGRYWIKFPWDSNNCNTNCFLFINGLYALSADL